MCACCVIKTYVGRLCAVRACGLRPPCLVLSWWWSLLLADGPEAFPPAPHRHDAPTAPPAPPLASIQTTNPRTLDARKYSSRQSISKASIHTSRPRDCALSLQPSPLLLQDPPVGRLCNSGPPVDPVSGSWS
ncbi:hypothetical protein IWZ03DRAFT_109372 [Phyllosticta citriasiana]|uniref:Secreted protein n=1 Tax=Phyllosticta citriasiana TaxID=595635 RepID=A0ABR1KVA0_9PEZI